MPGLDKRRILQGSASNLIRVILGMLISLVLPHFLVQHMGTAEYSAWVLILQLSAYVNFLDLGLQTAIGKFVAEYHAAGNVSATRKTVSTAFTVMVGAAMIGALAIFGMVWQVPRLFTQMPPALVGDVRYGLIAVGISVAFGLPFGVFLATFTGLQEYGFPTVLIASSRVVSTVGLIVLLLMHGTLVQLSLLMAACNIGTALLQFVGWKRYASNRIGFDLFRFDKRTSARLLEYCGVLTIWTIGALLISGLDTAIVGHFDYKNTGYYAIAASATNFMLLLVSNLLGPLLPAISSLQVQRTADELGALLVTATRLSTALLCMLGIPLLFLGFPLLRIWVGAHYASHALIYLEVLVAANIVRQLAYPYALMVVGLGQQRFATVSPVLEATINLISSILLARRYGAIGVAGGTLIGAFAGVLAHLVISMPRTRAVAVARLQLIREGVARPLLSFLPLLACIPFWRRLSMMPVPLPVLALWAVATASILWWVGLAPSDRMQMTRVVRRAVS
ncbi:MAG TPA: polysaccharide biosynthesis protein [Acidobacteriaceae bacterium]|jgi:O-antigen/teichoic acid export membrane protein